MNRFIAFIDPGDVHVGIAFYEQIDTKHWGAVLTKEITPEQTEDLIADLIVNPELVVLGWERFKLFGHLATQQIGSEFWTSQLIGVMKYLARTKGHPDLEIVIQDPSIQVSTEKIARAKGVALHSVTTKQGPHAKSAELHALYYLMRQDLEIIDWRSN